MIVSHIIGGLGNQMFQYALGRALSLTRNDELKLDLRDFSGYALHNGYELEKAFDLQVPLASNADLLKILGWRAPRPVRRFLMRDWLAGLRGTNYKIEPHLAYWPGITSVPGNCYLLGNWQTEKYFKNAETVIRADFSFKESLTGRNMELARQISACNAVSLHVRRGDFAHNPGTLTVHGLCSLEYYRCAIAHVISRIDRPEFFIFSDDMPWVRNNLQLNSPCHYVEHNSGTKSHNDMRLMSLCQHHIIANSSFSWWGAWLNPQAEKIVVAPERWFAGALNSSDIVPASWIRIRAD